MTQTPPSPPPLSSPPLPRAADRPSATEVRAESAREVPQPRRPMLAPQWLQVVLILGLLAAAVFVAWDGRYLWALMLGVAGLAFGVSFLLRRMVGDDYGRS